MKKRSTIVTIFILSVLTMGIFVTSYLSQQEQDISNEATVGSVGLFIADRDDLRPGGTFNATVFLTNTSNIAIDGYEVRLDYSSSADLLQPTAVNHYGQSFDDQLKSSINESEKTITIAATSPQTGNADTTIYLADITFDLADAEGVAQLSFDSAIVIGTESNNISEPITVSQLSEGTFTISYPTPTQTPIPTATHTPVPPTVTHRPVPTSTPIPPTSTSTPVPTETPMPTLTPTPTPSLLGDTDHDGDVDVTDLATLLSRFGTAQSATVRDGDFDNDGDVDIADLATLLAHFGK